MNELNTILWVVGNLTILLIFVAAVAFAIAYPILFDVKATTGGFFIWQAIASVAGIGFLIVIGLFVDGHTQWWMLPEHTAWWRPALRFLVYGLVAWTFTRLVYLLIVRRFRPEKLKTRPDESTLSIRPRDLHRKR